MKRRSSAETGLLVLLEKNLAVLGRLSEVLSRLEQSLPRAHHRAGLISYTEVCEMFGVKYAALYKRMARGTFPRPVQGKGKKAFWRVEDIARPRGRRAAKNTRGT